MYCNMLLKNALEKKHEEDAAYAYLCLADYSYYVKRNMSDLDLYLNKAKAYLSQEPSQNLIQYYTLRAMNNDATYDLRMQCIKHHMNMDHIITISAGISNVSKTNIILRKVLNFADQALYSAKEKGRNDFVKYIAT